MLLLLLPLMTGNLTFKTLLMLLSVVNVFYFHISLLLAEEAILPF